MHIMQLLDVVSHHIRHVIGLLYSDCTAAGTARPKRTKGSCWRSWENRAARNEGTCIMHSVLMCHAKCHS